MAHRWPIMRHRPPWEYRDRRHPIYSTTGGRPSGVIPEADLSEYDVNREGWEAVRQTLYDSASYVAAGQSTMAFFQTQQGQGSAILGSGGKTTSDTNMQLGGQLPAMQKFLVESIELQFWPTTPSVTKDLPAATGAIANDLRNLVNDAYIFARAGTLTFFVGSKNYLQEAPLGKFPAKIHFDVNAAVEGGTGDVTGQAIAFAKVTGRPYHIAPYSVLLISSQQFGVNLTWPEGAQTITNPAKVVCVLDGVLYRRSQ